MSSGPEALPHHQQAQETLEVFRREFERFERFNDDSMIERLALSDAREVVRDLEAVKIKYTGRKSSLSKLKKMIGDIATEHRRDFNQLLRRIEEEITTSIERIETALTEHVRLRGAQRDALDVTIPGHRLESGRLHPITLLRQRIEDIFVAMGYQIEDGPEVETNFYNFTALNIPESHPARSPLDTFYLDNGLALRPQTSTVQIRTMKRSRPPLRIIAPGRCFRRDTPDATHNPMFFQVEGLLVDRHISMADLKGTLREFVRRLFGAQTVTRFRPSFFPFTEPSAEVDYSCFKCNGKGCSICKGTGWIELGGSGMVHPNVLEAVDIDPEEWRGFAFGLGIDRMCALMYGLNDIRLLYENDMRFLRQFKS